MIFKVKLNDNAPEIDCGKTIDEIKEEGIYRPSEKNLKWRLIVTEKLHKFTIEGGGIYPVIEGSEFHKSMQKQKFLKSQEQIHIQIVNS